MHEQGIADLILDDAERYAAKKGYQLGEGAEHHFLSMGMVAARKIAEWPPGSRGRRAMTTKAKKNFHKMIDAMIGFRAEAYAGDAERMNGRIIGEATLGLAHQKLCPIWPFC